MISVTVVFQAEGADPETQIVQLAVASSVRAALMQAKSQGITMPDHREVFLNDRPITSTQERSTKVPSRNAVVLVKPRKREVGKSTHELDS